MALVDLQNIRVAFGGPPLLDGVSLALERGERVALVGRNGSGKTSLLRVLVGELRPEEGLRQIAPGTRVSLLTQEVPTAIAGTVYDVVAAGLGQLGDRLKEHHHLSHALAEEHSEEQLARLATVQHEIDELGGWDLQAKVETVLTRLDLPADSSFSELSGGLKRRVLLGQALVQEPELLLLDEPTNHLDLAAIEGLEELLATFRGALLFVTHDRAFLRRLATRIVELDRGKASTWPGDYDAYLGGKEEQLEIESRHNALFDKKLAQEEVWIRQGIKARRTRNEGRVRALEALRKERSARREVAGQARFKLGEAEKSGKRVIEVEKVSFGYGDKMVVRDFSTEIVRGDKIGILGPNGSGKTTLLRLLLGDLEPQRGAIRFGTKLEVAYFDQQRAALDPETSVVDAVADGNDRVTVGGQNRHVIGYLQDFLFSPERARTPVKALSGGERNRLLLAKLFARSFNVLVMDEPTNDLDVETLELLEELLGEFAGTLLLVSHDRAFLDAVVTSTLVFEEGGRIGEYVGGYEDWRRQRAAAAAAVKAKPKPAEPVAKKAVPRKLTFKEARDLEALPLRIETLEAEQRQLFAALADPNFYRRPSPEIAKVESRVAALETELAKAFARWQELESLAST